MAEKKLLSAIKALVICDQRMYTLQNTVSQKKDQLAALESTIATLNQGIKEIHDHILSQKKEADFQRLYALELKQDEDKKRSRLEVVSNPKEYRALERELEQITRKRIDLDDKIMKTWATQETQARQSQGLEKEKHEKIAELNEEKTIIENAIQEIQKELLTFDQTRGALFANVPSEWQGRYQRMRTHVHDPIVPVSSSSCSSCYYSILTQDLNRLKKLELLSCKNCYRILYFDEEQVGASPAY